MLDALDVLIGFVSVVLLLSVVSTFLVQSTSSLMRLRGRNLYRGLRETFLEAGVAESRVEADGGKEARLQMSSTLNKTPDEVVEDVLSNMPFAKLGRSFVHQKLGMSLRVRGTTRTWVSGGELQQVLTSLGVDDILRHRVEALYPQFEKMLHKRFTFIMRLVSISWALVVAVAFQVSAPELLTRLSSDPSGAPDYAAVLERASAHLGIPGEALTQLKQESDEPTEKAALQAVEAAEGATTEEVLQALNAALKDADKTLRTGLVDRYETRVERLRLESLTSSRGALATLDIELWRDADFYGSWRTPDWRRIFGVLITAGLLSLGAPFWFNLLKNAAALRDTLKPASAGDPEPEKS